MTTVTCDKCEVTSKDAVVRTFEMKEKGVEECLRKGFEVDLCNNCFELYEQFARVVT